ncbi:serine/threonine-protein kinase [Kitasatospora sp. LaBMicrA B282]|uniref:serine/threonine-protein kinase n=1 Tax=Kitasatospora sp. LaBMicrA B282 TaxID=3420949 RepID=UPI003D1035B5
MEPLEPGDPRQVGEYRLLRRLGAGGMGRVYLGRTAGGRTVAVKLVRSELAEDAEFRARFRQEVAAARRVGGRWTAAVLDADTEGRDPWVATSYVAGPALAAAVRESGPLPPDAVRALGAGLAASLAAVHALGLVHRDVKPSNVLLTLDGPRLIDFGIARALDATAALTRSGFMIGSPGFMSPEQAQGAVVGPASDVFTLAAVLAFAASGTAPFGEGGSVPRLMYRVVYEEPDLSALDPDLRAIVQDCLAKDPAQRPTPAALAERLDQDGAAAARMREGVWLPPALSASVGRRLQELVDLDHEVRPTHPGTVLDPGTQQAPPHTPYAQHVPPPPAAPPTGVFGAPQPAAPTFAAPLPTPAPAPTRRWPAILGAALLVAAVTAGTTLWLTRSDGSSAKDGSPAAGAPAPGAAVTTTVANPPAGPAPQQSTPQRSAPAASSAPAPQSSGSVPTAFLGTWHGYLGMPGLGSSVEVQITIKQGTKGAVVGQSTVSYGPTVPTCHAEDFLVSASADQLVLGAGQVTGGPYCTSDGGQRLYTWNSDGSLHLSVDNGQAQGDLTRTS